MCENAGLKGRQLHCYNSFNDNTGSFLESQKAWPKTVLLMTVKSLYDVQAEDGQRKMRPKGWIESLLSAKSNAEGIENVELSNLKKHWIVKLVLK